MKELEPGLSLMDQAYESIKRKIIDWTYPPGSFLTEAGLAKELETSRMPVRMAVRRLENEGWIVADFRKKIRVKGITRQDILEIYQLRHILEENALKMIFEQGKAQEYASRIEEKVQRIRDAHKDLYEWERADTQMHMELVSIYGNERINRIYAGNQDELIRIGIMSEKKERHVEDEIKGLYAFVEAIRAERLPEALDILRREHLISGQDMALEKIEG